MKRHNFKLAVVIFGVVCLFLAGCGDDDFGGKYISLISFTDAGGDVITLDMYRGVCDSGDPEPFTDIVASISVTVDDNSPGLTLNGYDIEYIPELSEDGTHTLVMPPDLNPLEDIGSDTAYISTAGTSSFTLTCFTTDQKEDYATLMTAYADLETSRYTIRFTLYFTDDNGQSKNIVVSKTVYFSNYDNC